MFSADPLSPAVKSEPPDSFCCSNSHQLVSQRCARERYRLRQHYSPNPVSFYRLMARASPEQQVDSWLFLLLRPGPATYFAAGVCRAPPPPQECKPTQRGPLSMSLSLVVLQRARDLFTGACFLDEQPSRRFFPKKKTLILFCAEHHQARWRLGSILCLSVLLLHPHCCCQRWPAKQPRYSLASLYKLAQTTRRC